LRGDTISYVDINNHQSVANVVIYSTGQLISINCENKYFTNVNVIDMSGKVLLSKTSRYNSLEIKINHLPKGAYIVKVLVDNIAITKKIIKY
jgi:5'(3')-deoxyribonucleotidase